MRKPWTQLTRQPLKARLGVTALEERLVPSFDVPILNFTSTSNLASPADPAGAVGLTQYVSGYNRPIDTVINVYDKATGAPIAGFQNKGMQTLTVTNVGTSAPRIGL